MAIKDKRPEVRTVERRVFNLTNCEVRTADGGASVFSGYAAVFDLLSVNLGGFRERIQKGCFRNAVDSGQDVRFLINHDANLLLGRTPRTVTLTEDEIGLRVECELPATSYANDLAISMERGDINQMSFGFYTRADAWKEKDPETGLPIRELVEADLFDVSVVTYPAYPDTEASLASVRSYIATENPEVLERAARAADELAETPAAPDPAAETPAEPETPEEPEETTGPDDLIPIPGAEHMSVKRSDLDAVLAMVHTAKAEDEADERAGKVLSKANADTLAAAVELLTGVLTAASDDASDTDDLELNSAPAADMQSLRSLLQESGSDAAAFKALLEERGWSWDDDWSVWTLTNMIESASCFLVCADDDDPNDAPLISAMGTIIEQLTGLLGQVVAHATAELNGAPADGEEREETPDDVAESRFDLERRRLSLRERELDLAL